MKTHTHRLVASLLAIAVPLSAAAAISLSQSSGYLKGGGTTPTHDFPLSVQEPRNKLDAGEPVAQAVELLR